jgi:hypothetical protein
MRQALEERTYVLHDGIVSRRLTLPELESMRRSLGMADQLPVDQVRYLIAEAERLLRERASIDATIARLGPPLGVTLKRC